MRAKLLSVLAWCWIQMSVAALAAAYLLWRMGQEILPHLPDERAAFWEVMAASLATGLLLVGYRFAFLRRRWKANGGRLISLTAARSIVHALCIKRDKEPPEVLSMNSGGDSLDASIIDEPFGPDQISVGKELESKLDQIELRVVLAHELRHDDAIENRLRDLLRIGRFWLAFLICFCLIEGQWEIVLSVPALVILTLAYRFCTAMISRGTEVKADVLAAYDVGRADKLISALVRIQREVLASDGRKEPVPTKVEELVQAIFGQHPPVSVRARILNWVFKVPAGASG